MFLRWLLMWPFRVAFQAAASLLVLTWGTWAAAQTPSASQLTPPTLRPAPSPGAPGIGLPESPPQSVPAGADKVVVTVRAVRFEGAYPDLADTVQDLTAAVTGRRVTVAQLYSYAAAVEQVYARAGYVLVRVVIPEQTLSDGGIFRLVVIDGYIEAVDVSAVPDRVRSVVAERTSALVDQHRILLSEIERRVLLAGDVVGIRLRSTLVRGQRPGGTRLVLEGTHYGVQGTVGTDNRLSEAYGRWQYSASVALNSAFSLGEQFYGTVTTSRSLDSWADSPLRVWGIGAVIPIGYDGFTINPEYTVSHSRPLVELGGLQTADEFTRFAVRASYPFIRTRSRSLIGNLAYERIEQVSEAIEFDQELNHDRYGVLRIGAEAAWVLSWGSPLTLSATFSRGLGGRSIGDAVATGVPLSRQDAEPIFDKLLLEARYAHSLPLGLRLQIAARGQTSFGEPLLKPEQFALDTSDILSGFDSGTFSVDRGAAVRAELGRPIAIELGDWAKSLTPYIFGAAGRGWLEAPTAVEQETVNAQSIGVGLRAGLEGPNGWPGGYVNLELARGYTDDPSRRHGVRATVSATARF